MASIGVATPFLNECVFARAWARNVKKFGFDDIVALDNGSTDGTDEILKTEGIKVIRFADEISGLEKSEYEKLRYWDWNTGGEKAVRTKLMELCKTDFIFTLDLDELVTDEFNEVITEIKADPSWLIGRMPAYMFWGDLEHIRVRSLKPLVFYKGYFRPLRNWRGKYPGRNFRIIKNVPEINYSSAFSHCILQYKNYGRASYYLPGVCRNFDVPYYHFHYCFPGVKNGNMDDEKEAPTLEFSKVSNVYPEELKLIQEDYKRLILKC